MSWKEKTKRFIYLIIAVCVGSGIVWALSLAGNKSKGPIENLLTHTTQMVQEAEHTAIIEQRQVKRSDKLAWFKEMASNKEALIRTKKILLGGSDAHEKETYESIINLEDSLQTTFPLISIYCTWGSNDDELFPETEAQTISDIGSVPVITWEPWLSEFDEKQFPGIPKPESRDTGCLAAIAQGTYDKYIRKWAKDAKEYQKPFFLRVGHEMNDPYRYPWGPQNNKPADFVAAWRHIHNVFNQVGATNVIWVWGPHLAYRYFDDFYPGDNYVDIVSTGVLNFGTAATWSQWWTFGQALGAHYKDLEKFHKPMMITEFGSLGVGGNRPKWYADALDDIPTKFRAIKFLVFYHYSSDKTTTEKALNWYIKDDPATVKAIRKRISTW